MGSFRKCSDTWAPPCGLANNWTLGFRVKHVGEVSSASLNECWRRGVQVRLPEPRARYQFVSVIVITSVGGQEGGLA